MALQKRRLGKHRVHSRRSAWMSSLRKPNLQKCPNPTCGAPKAPHRVCSNCGQYGGKQILDVTIDDDE